jgi:hypothetical protein
MTRSHDAQVLADILTDMGGRGKSGRRSHRLVGLGMVLMAVVAGCDSRGTGAADPPPPGGGDPTPPVGPAPTDAPTSGGPIDPGDIPALAVRLGEGTLKGRVHGAVHGRGVYVFTYYPNPNDIFVFNDFPMTPANDAVAQKLLAVKRHDTVQIRGAFVENIAPIKHIRLDDVTVTGAYTADEVPPKRPPVTRIPEDLPAAGPGGRQLIGKVHAVANDGRILVIEFGDAVMPIFVQTPALTQGLFRNDKIRVGFVVPPKPPRPTHLWLDMNSAKPLEVIERLVDYHGKPFEAEGSLIRFPKSPQITVDVYALQAIDADGVAREYTLLNQNPTVFRAILEKLGAAWKSRPGQGVDGRNKLINTSIRIKAKGTFNLIDRNQANAQILLDSADDVTVTMLP